MVFLAPANLEPEPGLFADLLQRDHESAEARAMTEISIAASDLAALRGHLLPCVEEKCAILFASQVARSDGNTRLLVRLLDFPGEEEYSSRGVVHAELLPTVVARVSKQAKRENLSLIFAHCHPGSSPPEFSPIDDEGEEHLARFLSRRNSDHTHAALVFSEGGVQARVLGKKNRIRVIALGENRDVLSESNDQSSGVDTALDRQVRAFGTDGQRKLANLKVAIVGLGGTGSIIAEQLAHLGIHEFTLIDPDEIEATNLNRVVGANAASIGKAKVEVAADHVRRISKTARVTAVQGNIVHTKYARHLVDADIIFGCTDSHGSRAVLQQVSYQYLIPCIDMGSIISTDKGAVKGIFGRVQLLSPGLACFTCSGLLDYAEVRRDMMSESEKKTDPYLQGAREPAPAVISLNGTVSSMAVTMLLAYVAGIPSRGRYLIYNAIGPTLRSARGTPDPGCYICSRSGAFARGDTQALQARQD